MGHRIVEKELHIAEMGERHHVHWNRGHFRYRCCLEHRTAEKEHDFRIRYRWKEHRTAGKAPKEHHTVAKELMGHRIAVTELVRRSYLPAMGHRTAEMGNCQHQMDIRRHHPIRHLGDRNFRLVDQLLDSLRHLLRSKEVDSYHQEEVLLVSLPKRMLAQGHSTAPSVP